LTIDDLPLSLQPKLLRLFDKEYERSAIITRKANIITATNTNLEKGWKGLSRKTPLSAECDTD
jgi:transcriptional regulator with GAF, ATPase, and Fis domain